MPGKVFHVSDGVHKMVAKHCRDNNLVLKEWVESTLMRGVIPDLTQPKKKIDRAIESSGDDPWIKPPFWKTHG